MRICLVFNQTRNHKSTHENPHLRKHRYNVEGRLRFRADSQLYVSGEAIGCYKMSAIHGTSAADCRAPAEEHAALCLNGTLALTLMRV